MFLKHFNALLRSLIGLSMLALTDCTGKGTGFMDPAGPIAGTERQMFFEIAVITLIVVVPIFVLVPWVLWHYRRKTGTDNYAPDWEYSSKLEWVVWSVPVLIVAALGAFLWLRTHQLDPYKDITSPGEPIEIQVVGLDWKWLFIYPKQGIASINEMAIPAGRSINLKLTSGTVMQSFHVPKLAGQIYAMAGMTTQLSLRADQTGTFRGRNTQYNGDGFAHQHFEVVALPANQFDVWVAMANVTGSRLDEAEFLSIAQQSVPDEPVYFRGVAPDMFDQILSLSTRAGAPLGTTARQQNSQGAR